ncbi:MAG: MerR family DNA-binding transcriptional regulator [Treponema sp.]|nr:MerR family DNA-binding transcriptional regulator [Treponema sp.]
MSKFTGASIKSLRYYEEIKILKPAFIDEFSGYRYYSFNQIYLIDLVMFCIELDIPLKKLTEYIDKTETLDYSALLAYGKGIAEKKLRTIQDGLKFIEDTQLKIDLAEKYQKGQEIYSREIPEKYFYVIPYNQSLDNADAFELAKPFMDLDDSEDGFYDFEYGYMCEYSPSGVQRYAFMELSKPKTEDNIKVIPGGLYFCKQWEESQIEQSPHIFRRQLKGNKSFVAIETEIFIGKYKINKPINELRVIGID